MLARLRTIWPWARRQRREMDRSAKFLKKMHKLAIAMDEDVDIVTERFEAFAGQVAVPWAMVYLPAYARVLDGIKDPWFYGSDADAGKIVNHRQCWF